MNRTRLRGILFAAMLLSANGFPTRAFASCSSYISGANEATVSCTAATDAFTIGWFADIDSTNSVVDVLYHVGPSTWGNDLWDWGNGSHLPPGATIRIAGLNGGSVTIGVQDESYATADHIPVNVILNQASGGGNIIFDASVSSLPSNWIVNDGASPYRTAVGQMLFTNNGTANLTIHTGTAMNTVNVWSVYGSDTLTVVGHGDNEVDIGNSSTGSARSIYGPVHVSSPCIGCYTTLNFHDWSDATGRTVAYTKTSVSGLAPANIDWAEFDISAVTLYAGTGADTVNVTSTDAPLTIHGTNGLDAVDIGNAGSAQGIHGAVTIDNYSNYTNILIDNSADATARMATLTDSSVTGIAPAAINWAADDIGTVTLGMGTGADTVNVLSTDPAVVIQGTEGHDRVTIGNGGSVQGIQGPVDVRNFLSRTALIIDDSADATGRTATYTKSGVTGLAPGAITWPQNDVSTVTLDMGTGPDTVKVQSVYSGSGDPLTIYGNDGLDSVYFGDDSGNAQQILTPVTVYNSASYTAVFVDDSADTIGRNVTYSKTGIGGVAPGHIGWSSNDVGSVRLYLGSGSDAVHVASSNRNVNGRSFINQIDLGGGNNECYVTGSGLGLASVNNFYGNAGDDQFVISAVLTDVASVNIYGGAQTSGDELVYTGGSATGAFPGNGTLTPTDINAHAINYSSIEQFSVHDWIFRDGF
jgi:hypothetical protein